jgi:hypothetical protein
MRLIGLAAALALGLTVGPLAAEAQQPGRVHRVGVIYRGGPYKAVCRRARPSNRTGLSVARPGLRTGRSPSSVLPPAFGLRHSRRPATTWVGLSKEFCVRAGLGPLDVGGRGRDRGAAWGPGRVARWRQRV